MLSGIHGQALASAWKAHSSSRPLTIRLPRKGPHCAVITRLPLAVSDVVVEDHPVARRPHLMDLPQAMGERILDAGQPLLTDAGERGQAPIVGRVEAGSDLGIQNDRCETPSPLE